MSGDSQQVKNGIAPDIQQMVRRAMRPRAMMAKKRLLLHRKRLPLYIFGCQRASAVAGDMAPKCTAGCRCCQQNQFANAESAWRRLLRTLVRRSWPRRFSLAGLNLLIGQRQVTR